MRSWKNFLNSSTRTKASVQQQELLPDDAADLLWKNC
jgi:hypothetical protein